MNGKKGTVVVYNYKTGETIILNEDLMQESSKLQKDDKQLFNAIYASFIKQNTDRKYSSGSDFVTWARNAIGKEVIDYSGEAGFINVLKTRLQAQDAPTISSSFSGGLHAVNAISLVQDIENPNYYYIGVYDNNYPGEKRYVEALSILLSLKGYSDTKNLIEKLEEDDDVTNVYHNMSEE